LILELPWSAQMTNNSHIVLSYDQVVTLQHQTHILLAYYHPTEPCHGQYWQQKAKESIFALKLLSAMSGESVYRWYQRLFLSPEAGEQRFVQVASEYGTVGSPADHILRQTIAHWCMKDPYQLATLTETIGEILETDIFKE
jgi:hypothetical protein